MSSAVLFRLQCVKLDQLYVASDTNSGVDGSSQTGNEAFVIYQYFCHESEVGNV